MIPFRRIGSDLVAELDDFEVTLIASLVSQVVELLGGSGEVGNDALDGAGVRDPFSQWAGEFAHTELDRRDPVVARLFPDAYADEVAAAEHRRYSQDGLLRARLQDSDTVLADLLATEDGVHPLVVALADLEAWIKTLNGVRLSLAVRLGIESESDHAALEQLPARDPRTQLVALYDWLAAVLESLLEAAHA